MSCNTARIAATRAREETAATQPDARATFTDLPRDIVNEILGLANPADLARLRAVNRAMRNAVAETGRFDLNVDTHVKLELGCLGALQRRRLSRQFGTVARSGQLEKLKDLRANGCPWNKWTCACAAVRGHLEVLKWLRANGCPWNTMTFLMAKEGGHLEVMRWALANGCPQPISCCFCLPPKHVP